MGVLFSIFAARSPSRVRHRIPLRAGVLLSLLLLIVSKASGQYVLEDEQNPHRYDPGVIILPFAFYSPTYKFGGGVAMDGTGFFQPQVDFFGYVLGSSDGTYGLAFGEDDFQLKPFDRLLLVLRVGYFQDQAYKAYIDGNPQYAGMPAGTNNSAQHDFFTRRALDVNANITFKFLLPIGSGRGDPISRYRLEDGILKSGATGGRGWNPFSTGRTYLQLTPFVEDLSLNTPGPQSDFHNDENGLRFGVVYDNTDFALNPSRGNISRLTISRDFGWFESSESWTNVSGEYAQFIDLGPSRGFRQKVLALDLWTSYSPTWDRTITNGVRGLSGAPPFYDGATLGGSERLRGFAEYRFWDRTAVYGAAELRLIPEWNPLGRVKLLKSADIAWMQWVAFVEVGRVSDDYSRIYTHLKSDAGVGLRILANDTLVRLDLAASSEGVALLAQLSQPF
jgi:hypothetical protein